jgi:hypothetical protein
MSRQWRGEEAVAMTRRRRNGDEDQAATKMVGRKITFRVRCRAERCFFLARGGILPSRHGSATPKVFLPPIARKIVMSIAV